MFGIALTIGEYDIGFLETYEIIWHHITGDVTDSVKDFLVIDARLPRVIVGIVAGAGLAISGATMQSVLKNPLADPYTTGVSSGAGFGATLAIAAGASMVDGEYSIVVNAFIFALIPTFAILSVARLKKTSPTVMIMAGIAVMYIFNACTTLLKLWTDPDNLTAIYRWTVGSLSSTSWDQVPIMLIATLIGGIVIVLITRELNILTSGDENAKALGVDVERMRVICMVVVALVSAAIVSFTGLIGFIGLVAPHVVRLFIGPDNRYLVPASAAFGAVLLITADLVGRTIMSPTVIQVGVITAFLGGPLFLWLIIRKDSSSWS